MGLFNQELNSDKEVKAGDLLLAEPLLHDPNFRRSVVLVCEHNGTQGTFGLVINQEATLHPNYYAEHFYLENNLYIGGPVQQDTLHFIHLFPEIQGCIPLKNGLYWGGNYEELRDKCRGGQANPSNCRFFVGYSGWGRRQLEEEINQNSWVISRIDLSVIFQEEADDLWKAILKQMGGKYAMFVNYPIDPSLN